MSRRRKEPTIAGLLVALLAFGFLLAVSRDWLGARDLYLGVTDWIAQRFTDSIRDAADQAATPSPAPAP
jgi:hypothetical protein